MCDSSFFLWTAALSVANQAHVHLSFVSLSTSAVFFLKISLLYSGLTISCADRNRSDAQVGAQIDGHERSHSVPSEKPPSGFELYFFTALEFARDSWSIVLTDCDIDTDVHRNIDWEDRERKAQVWNLPTVVVWTLYFLSFCHQDLPGKVFLLIFVLSLLLSSGFAAQGLSFPTPTPVPGVPGEGKNTG